MIYYYLFGPFRGDLQFILNDLKHISRYSGRDQLDPNIIFGMAKALYSIGQELDVGALKTLNLTNYSLISKSCDETLLVLVTEIAKKNSTVITQLESQMDELLFLFKAKVSNLSKNFLEPDLFDLINFKKSLLDILPFLKKTIKHLEIRKL